MLSCRLFIPFYKQTPSLALYNTVRHLKIEPKCVWLSPSLSVLTRPSSRTVYKRSVSVTRPLCIRLVGQIASRNSSKLENDVILYKYENPRFYRYLNLFGYSMFAFWVYMGFQFLDMESAPISSEMQERLPWFAKFDFGSPLFKFVASSLTVCLGLGCLAFSWMYSLRSVRYAVLRKSGDKVTFVTYNPLGKSHQEDFALSKISCRAHRTKVDTLPVKVKGKVMFYLLHKEGEYRSPKLFDATVGCYRGF